MTERPTRMGKYLVGDVVRTGAGFTATVVDVDGPQVRLEYSGGDRAWILAETLQGVIQNGC